MQSAFPGIVLTRDLAAADGRLVMSRGALVDLDTLREVAARAPKLREVPLHQTALALPVADALDAEPLHFLLAPPSARAQVADALAEVRFPQPIWDELEALGAADPSRLLHAAWTALVAARLFGCALGNAPGLSRLLGGALVHDLGMRLAAPRLRSKRDHLTPADALALEDHPLLGALLLASVLGDAPAVHLALLHHVRAGFGYPRVQAAAPLRGLDLIAVASAFAAMVAPRSYRSEAFSPRGAIDELLEEARAGHFDVRAVRLLVHCMRGGNGSPAELRFPRAATGARPGRNFHGLAQPAAAHAGT